MKMVETRPVRAWIPSIQPISLHTAHFQIILGHNGDIYDDTYRYRYVAEMCTVQFM